MNKRALKKSIAILQKRDLPNFLVSDYLAEK